MASVATWERELGRPVVTTNQASFWAMLRAFGASERLPAYGRLLAELPADPAAVAARTHPAA
jgi:maleate cis-trans isomerase